MRSSLNSAVAAFALAVVSCIAVSAGDAQGIRIRGTTTMRFLELRPFVDDSVPFDATLPGAVEYRQLPNGTVVRCVEGDPYCLFKRSATAATSLPLVQDIELTGWGLGRGLSVHADVRFRGALGSQRALYPREGDSFDALSAYVQLDRTYYTAKVGRQYAASGLGVYNYDGASLSWRPNRRIALEGFGGWSLAQSLNESVTTSEIAAVDELPPDRNAYIVGAQLQLKPTSRSSFSALYQRELRVNRSALYSERAAMDGSVSIGNAAIDGAFQYDLSMTQVNELRVRVRAPQVANTVVSLEGRHFRPFFELWTIWGAFSPVGFDEARLDATWRNSARTLSVDVNGARRKWGDTQAGLDFAPLRDDGWRVGGGLNWRATKSVQANASYSADVGFGASRSEGDVGLHWERGRGYIGVTGSTFQSIYEFRVGTNRDRKSVV